MIKTRLVRLLAHARKYIVYQILWQWAALWAQIVMIFTLTGTLDKILKNEWKGSEDFPRVLAIFLGVLALRILCDHGAAKASYLASADVKRVLRGKIYGKLLNLGVSYREQITTSEVVQLCTEGVEQLETYFLDNFRDDDWYGGFGDYIDACSNYLQLAEQGTPVSAPEGYDSGDYEDYEATPGENFGVSFLMALGISCVISIIICLLLLLKMHTVHQKTEANDYVSEKLKLSRKEDRYTHTTQTRRKIERESSSSSSTHSESGGGGSGRSGKF